MGINFAKLFGWILLAAGLIIIVWTLYYSYNVFTSNASLPEFFPSSERSVLVQPEEAQGVQAQLEKALGEQLETIIPKGSINNLLNLIVWSILAGLLIFGGSQISGLGIRLIKN